MILQAQNRFSTFLTLAPLRLQKGSDRGRIPSARATMSGSFLAEKPGLKDQGFPICTAAAPLREEPFA